MWYFMLISYELHNECLLSRVHLHYNIAAMQMNALPYSCIHFLKSDFGYCKTPIIRMLEIFALFAS